MADSERDKSIGPPFFAERLRFKRELLAQGVAEGPQAFIEPKANTTYEELACVGFQPELNRLEAVVHIKQPIGYGGDVCSAGTPEYVRFFLSFDGGATWHDQGVTSFTAYDIPAAAQQRLEYAVGLTIDPPKYTCKRRNFVLVRAILSWNVMPEAGNPGYGPHWGNAHDTSIQVAPVRRSRFAKVLEEAKVNLPADLADVLDLEQEVSTLEPKVLTLAQLLELYRGKKVEPHRFGLAAALQIQDNPQVLAAAAAKKPVIGKEFSFDLGAVLDALAEPKGNTAYEELDCVGLDPVHSELVATFRVKLGWGYSGGPCTAGSVEYVTFWGDFNNNGTYETCLGTVGVRAHDYGEVPKAGLEYAVSLPVDLNPYRKPCQAGPRTVRIRAMLSWNVPHPCAAPNTPPVWGNAQDTVIQIPPGPSFEPGLFQGYLYTVCGVNICAIDPVSGLTTAADQPFGDRLDVTGEIPAATSVPVPDRFKYKVWYRFLDPAPGPWQSAANDFWIWVTSGSGVGIPSTSLLLQQVDPAGWYTYREFGSPVTGNWRRVTGSDRLMGRWLTTVAQTGRWEIGLEFLDTATAATYWASFQGCPDGSLRRNAVVRLDQVRPAVSLSPNIEVSADGGATWQPALQCDTLVKGVRIRGTYSVSDSHFRHLHLYVEPAGPAHGAVVVPASRAYGAPDFVPTTGETGTWTLDTTPMDPCGYVIRLDVWDRTIVGCDADGWYNWASLGFCLKAR
jgi:hypothetical protein